MELPFFRRAPRSFAFGWRGLLLALVAILFHPHAARSQWATETYTLTAGWNGVWLPLDCTYDDIGNVLSDIRIEEVWRWNPPASSTQFTTSPQTPLAGDVQWNTWIRATPVAPLSTFFSLSGNTAYLFKVADSVGSGTITVPIKGKPVAPVYAWKESGTNLFGFPIAGSTSFEQYFSYSSTLNNGPAIFAYLGGAGLQPTPTRITAPRTASVVRNRAYWVQTTAYTDFYAPFKVAADSTTFDFGTAGYTASMRLTNPTSAPLSITVASVNSATPPTVLGSGPQPPTAAGAVPIKIRGSLDPASGTYGYATLPATLNLAAGEDREVVFTLDRSSMGSTAGADFQSLLRLSDSLGQARIDLPVHAVTTSLAGVWIGTANLTQVDQIVGDQVTSNSPRPVNSPMPVRFIVHMDDSSHVTLLQQVYFGAPSSGNAIRIAATKQSGTTPSTLDQTQLASATRLSSASFPVGLVKSGSGSLGISGSAGFLVSLSPGASTNPFLHIYHPDHGPAQSYLITRKITLDFDGADAASDPTFGSSTLGGNYTELVSGLRAGSRADAAFPTKVLDPNNPQTTRPGTGLQASGRFVLRRVATLSTLNQ